MCVAALVFSCPAVKSQHFKKSVPRIEVQNVKILLSCTRPVPLESGPPTLAVGPHRWYSDLGGKGEYAKPRLRVAQIWTASVFSRDGIGWGARVPPTLTIGPNRWYSDLGFALTDPPQKMRLSFYSTYVYQGVIVPVFGHHSMARIVFPVFGNQSIARIVRAGGKAGWNLVS